MHVVKIVVPPKRRYNEVALNGVADDQRSQRAVQAVQPEISVVYAVIEAVASNSVFATQGGEEQVVVGQKFDWLSAIVSGVAHFISQ